MSFGCNVPAHLGAQRIPRIIATLRADVSLSADHDWPASLGHAVGDSARTFGSSARG